MDPRLKPFYNSKAWQRLRYHTILERGLKCERCGKTVSKDKELQVHHKIEVTVHNVSDHNIALNPENLEIICHSCHNKAHDRFSGGVNRKNNKRVHIVYGAPLSGKKTYVRNNMSRGDIVVDMDNLYHAVSLMDMYDKPDNLKYNVLAIKNMIIDNIKTRYGGFKEAWIIGGYATNTDRDRLATELGADLIFINATKEECMSRLDTIGDFRSHNKAEWIRYIEKWFDEYRE